MARVVLDVCQVTAKRNEAWLSPHGSRGRLLVGSRQFFGMFLESYRYVLGSLSVCFWQLIGMFPESFPSPFYLIPLLFNGGALASVFACLNINAL